MCTASRDYFDKPDYQETWWRRERLAVTGQPFVVLEQRLGAELIDEVTDRPLPVPQQCPGSPAGLGSPRTCRAASNQGTFRAALAQIKLLDSAAISGYRLVTVRPERICHGA